MRHTRHLLALLATVFGMGCERAAEKPAPAASASAPLASASVAAPALRGPVAGGIPLDPTKIAAVVNPRNEPAWSGNAGRVRGLVTATGDAPQKQALRGVPADCERANEMYGTLFREGMMRSLADVLVTVTGYRGYVPAREDVVSVAASGCAWDRRTIALTLGQRLEVVSKDRRSYMPKLEGGSSHAVILALPGGEPIKLYPMKSGPFRLIDIANEFIAADVVVLKYPTHMVTRLDGHYEIGGIPPGEVTVTAFLPATMRVVEKKVTVPAGGDVVVDFEVPFEASAASRSDGGKPIQRAGAKAPSRKP